MEFFRDRLAFRLVQVASQHSTFAADLFSPRPKFEEIRSHAAWAQEKQEQMQALMDRKACPLAWLAFFMDQQGAWMLAASKKPTQLNNMRSGLTNMLSVWPKAQQDSVKKTVCAPWTRWTFIA